MDNEFDNFDEYGLNFNKIVNDNTMLSVTRLLASQLQQNPYITVKDFFEGLSDEDLEVLLEVADALEREADNDINEIDHGHELILITEMLVRAEGLITATAEEMFRRIQMMCMFLACESLFRKGIVKLHRDNLSFGEDMLSQVIVEKIDGIDYDSFE